MIKPALTLLISVGVVLFALAALAQPVQWTLGEGGNGHWYEYVPDPTWSMTWRESKLAAEARMFSGHGGHLATVTSQEENDWIWATFGPDFTDPRGHVYIGAYTLSQTSPWSWITGETWDFTNWDPTIPEPNYVNCAEGEGGFFLELVIRNITLYWNDTNNNCGSFGYIVEWWPIPVPVETDTWGQIKALFRGEGIQ